VLNDGTLRIIDYDLNTDLKLSWHWDTGDLYSGWTRVHDH